MDDEDAGSAVRPWRRLSSLIRRQDASIRRREPRSVAGTPRSGLGGGCRRRSAAGSLDPSLGDLDPALEEAVVVDPPPGRLGRPWTRSPPSRPAVAATCTPSPGRSLRAARSRAAMPPAAHRTATACSTAASSLPRADAASSAPLLRGMGRRSSERVEGMGMGRGSERRGPGLRGGR